MELRLLDASTGRTQALTSNGAVNVEPRWSPDGRRIAFVSTAYNQRFHIHTIGVAPDGAAGSVERLTEDSDSRLPRYYYGAFDHFLSPTWSPDGSEILFVSNRGHIWGTGGFWRMKATPGSTPRLVHDEETTWKARPDWAKDGRRVVYSSYLGRQWNQLWLMTADGGDAFPIGYGDYDATSPRWSYDGRRIAFISNEGGNTALWIQDIPGGRRSRVEITERRHAGPVGTLRVEVVDARSGAALPARVSVTSPDGRSHAPDDAWRHADDAFDRTERKIEYGYFHTRGAAALTVPAGKIAVEVVRGLEYRVAHRDVTVGEGGTETVRVPLERLDDLPSRGWWSGDVHVHMNYGGAYRNTPPNLVAQAQAEDLHVVEDLIVNKEQRVPDVAYFDGGRLDPASTPDTLLVHSQEYHTSYWGHTGLLGLTRNVLLPGYVGYVNTPAGSLYPHNAAVADLAHAQGALFGYVHPFEAVPDPAKANEPLTDELPADVALGKVDYYEVVGFSDHLATAKVWYRLLNCGFRLPAGGGTDAMANYASLRGPVGMNRVFVKTGGRPRPRGMARGPQGGPHVRHQRAAPLLHPRGEGAGGRDRGRRAHRDGGQDRDALRRGRRSPRDRRKRRGRRVVPPHGRSDVRHRHATSQGAAERLVHAPGLRGQVSPPRAGHLPLRHDQPHLRHRPVGPCAFESRRRLLPRVARPSRGRDARPCRLERGRREDRGPRLPRQGQGRVPGPRPASAIGIVTRGYEPSLLH